MMRFIAILFFCFMPPLAVFAQADNQNSQAYSKVVEVSSHEGERVFYMDALIETVLPNYISNAVYNGVPIPLLLQIEVKEKLDWWPDRDLVTIEQRYSLDYLPLFEQIQLSNDSQGSKVTLSSVAAALKKIGDIKHFPFLDKEHFKTENEIHARIRLKVNVKALPKPLRTESFLGGNWNFSSAWKEWRVK